MKKSIDKTILEYNCGIAIMPDYMLLDKDSDEDLIMMDLLFYYSKIGMMKIESFMNA